MEAKALCGRFNISVHVNNAGDKEMKWETAKPSP
jgi:hypothetical protein